MDAVSKAMTFLTHGLSKNVTFMFASVFPVPRVPWGWHGVSKADSTHPGGLCQQLRDSKLRETQFFVVGYNQTCPFFALKGDIIFIILDNFLIN